MKTTLYRITALLALVCILAGCGAQASPVDMDLSNMSETMVYSTVLQIAENPTDYVGKTIRMEGTFGKLYSEAMDRDYYSCDVKDQKGCCTEGIEFILPEGQKYPEIGDKITVSGSYEIYEEDGGVYGQLIDAVLE